MTSSWQQSESFPHIVMAVIFIIKALWSILTLFASFVVWNLSFFLCNMSCQNVRVAAQELTSEFPGACSFRSRLIPITSSFSLHFWELHHSRGFSDLNSSGILSNSNGILFNYSPLNQILNTITTILVPGVLKKARMCWKIWREWALCTL